MNITSCSYAEHAPAILDILNEAIATSTALYDYRPRSLDTMRTWFEAKERSGYPVLGAEGPQGELLGFTSYGSFRAWPAYKYTVEHSVYVHREHRGQGVGHALLKALIGVARQQGHHVLVGGIDERNEASIALHRRLGFVHAGTLRQVGFKFAGWLDLAFYQLTLDTPLSPCDG